MIYSHLKTILPLIPNPTIIEIGAHIGTDTAKLIRLLSEPYTYYAIEPDRRNLIRLHDIINPIAKKNNITILPFAISNHNGYADFYLSQGITRGGRQHTDSNSLQSPINHPVWNKLNITFTKAKIQCYTLDHLLLSLVDNVSLIWMDVQGAELKVFEGAKGILAKTDYVYTECQTQRYIGQPGLKGITEALTDFEIVFNTDNDVLLKRKI